MPEKENFISIVVYSYIICSLSTFLISNNLLASNMKMKYETKTRPFMATMYYIYTTILKYDKIELKKGN